MRLMVGTNADLLNVYSEGSFLIFLHIQKTAGMTLQRYLRNLYGPGTARRLLWRILKDQRTHAATIGDAARSRVMRDRYFLGHFSFGMHQNLPRPATYMTFVRKPVDRLVSLYRYSKHNVHAYYHKQARDADFEDFCFNSGLLELDNGMVRFIMGCDEGQFINRAPFGTLDDCALTKAKRNIDESFFFVGVQERFDESFLLLAKLLGDPAPRYLKLNVAKMGSTMDEVIAPEVIKRVQHSHQLDQELYEYCASRLSNELELRFTDLQHDIYELQRRNLSYNRLGEPFSNLSRRFRSTP